MPHIYQVVGSNHTLMFKMEKTNMKASLNELECLSQILPIYGKVLIPTELPARKQGRL